MKNCQSYAENKYDRHSMYCICLCWCRTDVRHTLRMASFISRPFRTKL